MTRRAAALLVVAIAWTPPVLAQTPTSPLPGLTPGPQPVVTSLTLFAGTRDGLLRSGDWGRSWKPADAAAAGVSSAGVSLTDLGTVHCIQVISPRIYVCGAGGLYVSENFGATWERRVSDKTVLAVLPSRYPRSDPTIFLGTPEGLFKSTDAGKSFTPTSLMRTPIHRLEWPGPALVVATGTGVAVSNDSGETFRQAVSGLPAGDVRALALSSFFAVDPVLFASVSSEGVFRSGDGGKNWASAGLAGRSVSDLVWLGPFLYAAADAGVFRTQDLGRNWVPLNEGLNGDARRLLFPHAPDSGSEIFAATGAGVFRSADGGLHWAASGLPGEEVLTIATFPAPERTPGKRGKK